MREVLELGSVDTSRRREHDPYRAYYTGRLTGRHPKGRLEAYKHGCRSANWLDGGASSRIRYVRLRADDWYVLFAAPCTELQRFSSVTDSRHPATHPPNLVIS